MALINGATILIKGITAQIHQFFCYFQMLQRVPWGTYTTSAPYYFTKKCRIFLMHEKSPPTQAQTTGDSKKAGGMQPL